MRRDDEERGGGPLGLPRKFLLHLCKQEAEERRQRRVARLLKPSGLPDGKSLGNLDEASQLRSPSAAPFNCMVPAQINPSKTIGSRPKLRCKDA